MMTRVTATIAFVLTSLVASRSEAMRMATTLTTVAQNLTTATERPPPPAQPEPIESFDDDGEEPFSPASETLDGPREPYPWEENTSPVGEENTPRVWKEPRSIEEQMAVLNHLKEAIEEQEREVESMRREIRKMSCVVERDGKLVTRCRTYVKRGSWIPDNVSLEGDVRWYGRRGPEKVRLERTVRRAPEGNNTRYGVI